jgi:hypothetical protein
LNDTCSNGSKRQKSFKFRFSHFCCWNFVVNTLQSILLTSRNPTNFRFTIFLILNLVSFSLFFMQLLLMRLSTSVGLGKVSLVFEICFAKWLDDKKLHLSLWKVWFEDVTVWENDMKMDRLSSNSRIKKTAAWI